MKSNLSFNYVAHIFDIVFSSNLWLNPSALFSGKSLFFFFFKIIKLFGRQNRNEGETKRERDLSFAELCLHGCSRQVRAKLKPGTHCSIVGDGSKYSHHLLLPSQGAASEAEQPNSNCHSDMASWLHRQWLSLLPRNILRPLKF